MAGPSTKGIALCPKINSNKRNSGREDRAAGTEIRDCSKIDGIYVDCREMSEEVM